MNLLERLRWAIAPDKQRSAMLLLGGVGVFVLVGGLATLLEMPRALAPVLALAMLAAWLAGLCGVVGYLRWFWRSEVDQQSPR